MNAKPATKVVARHSADCKYKSEGPYTKKKKCTCRKSFIACDGVTRANNGKLLRRVISAKTRSWQEAEDAARDWRDDRDPIKAENKRLKAEKEREQKPIEDAVALYLANAVTRLGDNGTVAMYRSLLGHVDPQTKQVTASGHLFSWLDKQTPRPVFVADLTPERLAEWRNSWTFGDLTGKQRWTIVKGFFAFCESLGWIDRNPASKLKPLKVKKGNRTAPFTDEQYDTILRAVRLSDPENVPAVTSVAWQQRLTTFLELLRWSGMALVDGVLFRPESVDHDGVLRYQRKKTGELGTIQLPDRLITLIRDIPLERDSVGPHQPFRTNAKIGSDTATWSRRLKNLFTLADIIEVTTGCGRARPPHAHMLRDTFAVWNLRHGVSIYAVAKMLGDNPTTVAKAYLPFAKELENATIAEGRKALEAGLPKRAAGERVVTMVRR